MCRNVPTSIYRSNQVPIVGGRYEGMIFGLSSNLYLPWNLFMRFCICAIKCFPFVINLLQFKAAKSLPEASSQYSGWEEIILCLNTKKRLLDYFMVTNFHELLFFCFSKHTASSLHGDHAIVNTKKTGSYSLLSVGIFITEKNSSFLRVM